jgi:hypothetical protein
MVNMEIVRGEMGCNKINCQKHKRAEMAWKRRAKAVHRDVVRFLKRKRKLEKYYDKHAEVIDRILKSC